MGFYCCLLVAIKVRKQSQVSLSSFMVHLVELSFLLNEITNKYSPIVHFNQKILALPPSKKIICFLLYWIWLWNMKQFLDWFGRFLFVELNWKINFIFYFTFFILQPNGFFKSHKYKCQVHKYLGLQSWKF